MKARNADRIVSISAIVVSVATLLMILYQTNLMRKEQKSSVMPSLVIGYGMDKADGQLNERVWLENQGLGPAFIEKILVKKDGQNYEGDLHSYFRKINSNKNEEGIRRFYKNYVIPKNDGRTLYKKTSDSSSVVILGNYFKYPYSPENIPDDNTDKAVIEIYYKNVYGDRWKISSDTSIPERLD